MKKITTGLFALAASAVLAGNAHAQIPNITPFAIEARGGLALPQGDLKEGLENGYTLGANISYNFLPSIAGYVGFTRSAFGVEGVEDISFIDQGIDAGIRVGVPTPLLPIDPFFKAGVIYHKVEFDLGDLAEGNFSSDNELGFEVGAGLGFNILPKLQLTPAVTYSQFTVDAEDPETGAEESLDVKNLRVDIGLRLRI